MPTPPVKTKISGQEGTRALLLRTASKLWGLIGHHPGQGGNPLFFISQKVGFSLFWAETKGRARQATGEGGESQHGGRTKPSHAGEGREGGGQRADWAALPPLPARSGRRGRAHAQAERALKFKRRSGWDGLRQAEASAMDPFTEVRLGVAGGGCRHRRALGRPSFYWPSQSSWRLVRKPSSLAPLPLEMGNFSLQARFVFF